jgi:hypothetical protein
VLSGRGRRGIVVVTERHLVALEVDDADVAWAWVRAVLADGECRPRAAASAVE